MVRTPTFAGETKASSARVGGRYVVQGELASGGMGAVYRVRDESTSRTVALKRLRSDAGAVAKALFRREYHTLVLLKHPRIIEVYDYGLDGDAPYYTMELLDGVDLGSRAPLGYVQACRLLRDVASSAALLAAHRLVHRDLTARNVRVTGDGRCKVIDFGALAPFGVSDDVIGTPPYVPPETARGLPLDQRSDLYSLGALAYFLLTKSHAYPAQALDELESLWTRRPERPSVRLQRLIEQGASLEPLPTTLDDLVLSLLSLDPMARPQSAAEVIERLETIAALEHEPGLPMAQSHVLSAAFVGRGDAVERTRALAGRTVAGHGGALVIHHAAGMGGTRLLNELGLETRLAGATVLRVDAGAVHGPMEVARTLVARLLTNLPAEAKAVAPPELVELGWVRRPISTHPSGRPAKADALGAPLEQRLRLQSALEQWFLEVARTRPLALQLDNAARIDEGSAAWLARLTVVAKDHPVLLLLALRTGEAAVAVAPLQGIQQEADHVDAGALSELESEALLRSIFGDVPNIERLARWLHRFSAGSPLGLTESAQDLVERGLARYTGGIWVLPHDLPPDFAAQVQAGQADRLSNLSSAARALAAALALHRGHAPVDLCLALLDAGPVQSFGALDELMSAGVLVGYANGYQFAQQGARERLLSEVSAEAKQALHRQLGEYFARDASPDLASALDSGWHLLLGGEPERGAEILRRVGLELAQADELAEAIPVLEATVEVYRRLNRSQTEICGLVHPLAFAGYYVERRLADRYGDEALELLAREVGLATTVRLRPLLGRYLSLFAGLVHAVVRHCFGRSGGLRALNEKISITGGLSTALIGAAVICMDVEGAKRRARVFAPFEPLGLRHAGAFCHAMGMRLIELTQDRPAASVQALQALLQRFDSRWGVIGFPKRMRPITRGGLLYGLGLLESFTDAPRSLERASQLESCGLRLYDMVASQIRANYHGVRGEIALMRAHERHVELYAIQNGSSWQVEVWAPISHLMVSRLTFDVVGVKRACEELERLSREIPTLARYAAAARTALLLLRGDWAEAIEPIERLLSETEPHGFIGWTAIAASLAEAHNRLGNHARAYEVCESALREVSAADRAFAALNLGAQIELARAEAGLGRAPEAIRRLESLIEDHTPNRGPVTLGSLHRARAQLSHDQGDTETTRQHHAQMSSWFRSTDNPALVAECERQALLLGLGSVPPRDDQVGASDTSQEATRATSRRKA